MNKRYGSILIVSVTIFVLCLVVTASATNWSVDGSGGADFTGIQDAINNAKDGDTIIVHSGVYYENVVVDKSVTLKGIGHPVVAANGSGSAITLSADGITLVGFTATNSGSMWACAGIRVISSSNFITGNNVCNNNRGGISLRYSSNNRITGNTFENDGLSVHDSYQNTVEDNTVNGKPLVYLEDVSNYKVEDAGQVILVNCNNITVEGQDLFNTSVGIRLWTTEDSKILNNTVSNNRDGIRLWNSYNNSITGNNVCNNNDDGIRLDDSSNNKITGNNASNNNDDGICLSYSNNNKITGNNVSNNDDGICLSFSSNNNTITGNNASNNVEGIYLYDSCNNTITGNNVSSNNWGGIHLYYSSNNTITGNNASNNNRDGIYISRSSNNKITGNNACNNRDGIYIWNSYNNSITGNNASNNNRDGIYISRSSNNNTITGNNVSNNVEGIYLDDSCNNTLTGNTFVIDGLSISRSYQNTVEGNTVNDKPLAYLEAVSDYKVEDAGQVILVNCTNITVENLDLSYTCVGIELLNTKDSNILNNTVCNNIEGIDLYYSSNNKIYFNNFINNTNNVDSYKSTNIWNSPLEITYTYSGSTYKSYLGNYWDDYEGTDAEGDGIGDTHYSIDSKDDESDDYPLMDPFENYILTTSHE